MAKSKHKIVWGARGWLPAYFGFCPSKKAWDKQMSKMGIEGEPYPDTDAKCTAFFNVNPTGGAAAKTIILVTVGDHIDALDHLGIIGLLVHEGTHVWQYMCEDAGEDKPSQEAEAYGIQNIVLSLIDGYSRTRNVEVLV